MNKLTKNSLPGDLFYVPATSKEGMNGIVIGRYIETVPGNLGYLVEIFDKFYNQFPSSLDETDLSTRLFRPILTNLRFPPIPPWHTLLHNSQYNKEQSNYHDIAFAFDSTPFPNTLWKGGKSYPLPINGLKIYEPPRNWAPLHIILRVNTHLEGIFGPDDIYDFHKLPERMKLTNPDVSVKLILLANEINDMFKKFKKN